MLKFAGFEKFFAHMNFKAFGAACNFSANTPPRRRILEAKILGAGRRVKVERSRMRRAIPDTVSNVIHDRAEPPAKASEARL